MHRIWIVRVLLLSFAWIVLNAHVRCNRKTVLDPSPAVVKFYLLVSQFLTKSSTTSQKNSYQQAVFICLLYNNWRPFCSGACFAWRGWSNLIRCGVLKRTRGLVTSRQWTDLCLQLVLRCTYKQSYDFTVTIVQHKN